MKPISDGKDVVFSDGENTIIIYDFEIPDKQTKLEIIKWMKKKGKINLEKDIESINTAIALAKRSKKKRA